MSQQGKPDLRQDLSKVRHLPPPPIRIKTGEGNETKKSCNCTFKEVDQGGQCDYCERSFERISSFVMHVAKNKLCKEFYGEEFEHWKATSRRITKQQWYCRSAHGSHGKEFKEARKKQRQASNKTYHVPNQIRYSECGKAFEAKFIKIYKEYLDEAKAKISDQCIKQRYLRQDAMDQALDNTFKDCSLEINFKKTMEMNEDETLILQETFGRLESTFQNDFERIYSEKRKAWKDNIVDDIQSSLVSSVYNRVFLELYEKSFEDKAEDNTLDTIFLTLVTTEEYFNDEEDLESQMKSAYYKVKKEELKKLFEENIELENKMKGLIEKKLRQIFRKHELKY